MAMLHSVILVSAAALPLFHMTLRGWTNGLLFLLGLLSLICLLRGGVRLTGVRRGAFWVMVISLCAPLVTELIAMLLLGRTDFSVLDGPSRFLVAALVFGCLATLPVAVPMTAYALILPLSIFICLAAYLLNPAASQMWGGRAASYFVDTLTFGTFNVIIGYLCLSLAWTSRRPAVRIMNLAAFGVALYIAVMALARTAWVCAVVLAVVFPLLHGLSNRKQLLAYLGGLIIATTSLYLASDAIRARVEEASREVTQYVAAQSADTSVGLRISMARLDLHLFASHWITGVGDAWLPPYEELRRSETYLTPLAYAQRLNTGSHNEVLAQLSRKGIWGALGCVGLFIAPLWLFVGSVRNPRQDVRMAARMGSLLTLGLMTAGLTIQIFNLKYTSSFYAAMVAIFAAGVVRQSGQDDGALDATPVDTPSVAR